MNYKICGKCKKEKPATPEYFSRDKNKKDGLSTTCKICCSEWYKKYRESRKEELNAYGRNWRKNNKDYVKNYNSAYGPRYYEEHKDIINQKHKIYNRDYIKTPHGRLLDIAKKNKRKALKRDSGGSYTVKQWQDCLDFFEGRCAYTGELLDDKNTHIDHIIPLSRKGSNHIWNICPSIYYANLYKSDNDMEDWYRQQEYFSEERLNKIKDWIEYAEFMY